MDGQNKITADLKSHKRLIILVEDEDIIARLLIKKLESAGYIVKLAKDGESAVSMISGFEPDLVLLDMMLPKLNGFGVLEKLYQAKILPKLPVIIISNSGQPIELDRAIKLGIRDYLIKVNFDPSEVLLKVNAVFGAVNGQEVAPSDLTDDRDKPSPRKKSVLIIEDDQLIVTLLERRFKENGIMVYTTDDLNQARSILSDGGVDLVLLDIVLPRGNGFEFLQEVKADENFKKIPVVLISNLGQQDEVKRGVSLGAADYIIKAHTFPADIVKKVIPLMK